jgi:hypothetical protein
MRQMVATGAVVALLMGLAGCGGDDLVGAPADAGPPIAVDLSKKLSLTKDTSKIKVTKPPAARN